MKEYLNGFAWGEGLRWQDGALYFSDIYGMKVFRSDGEGQKEVVLSLSDMPSGLGFLPDGCLLVVSGGDKKVMKVNDGAATVYADLSDQCVGINDMVVDRQGNVYVGAYGFAMQHYRGGKADGWVFHISPNGTVQKVCEGLQAPNGMVVTPDCKTLIVADTFKKQLIAYTLDENGLPKEERVWAELSSGPDGICLDRAGAVWAALPNESKVARIEEGGKITRELFFQDTPLCCVLGGKNGNTLFTVTVPAHKDLSADELSDFDRQRKKNASVIYTAEV